MPVSQKKKKPKTRNSGRSYQSRPQEVNEIIRSAPRGPLPQQVKPMLAVLSDKAFDDPDWLFEIKWDGYRAIAILDGKRVTLQSRNVKSFNEKFYPVYDSLVKWDEHAVLDGEIVVINENGIPHFGALQNWRSEADGELVYYVFDILWKDGHDLRQLELKQRKKVLKSLENPPGIIRISEGFDQSGISIFESVKKMGLEGIIAKKQDSPYLENNRSGDWLKIKTQNRQEVIIGGYTLNQGSDKLFSSLLVGVYNKNDFVYTGKIGTGFNRKMQEDLIKKFEHLVTAKSPFSIKPDINKPSRFRSDPPAAKAVWLKPRLICEVSFTEMTSDGLMRHPSYEGLRTDKKPKSVILERKIPKENIRTPDGRVKRPEKKKQKKFIMPVTKQTRKTLLNPTDETQVKTINGHAMKFSHLSKIYWPKQKLTKRDLINYYYRVAPYILPYLKNRPQSLNRHPDGITGESFYQKDVKGKAPEWTEKFAYRSEGDNRDKEFLVCTDEASLLYMASLGCIEMNPWSSTVDKPDHPSWCIIDFDPDNNPFNEVIEAARVTHQILESSGVDCFCKTSGSTGIHIYIPLGAKYTYEESKEFARLIVTKVNQEIPGFTSIERIVAKRKGKIYLDFLQNRPQATLAAPYSLRPKPGATVSMPIHWTELKKGLRMENFTINNSLDRISTEGDIFKPVLGKGINIRKALTSLEKL
jgi:bifunctional non-homologous end joining protein LigD